VTRAVIGHKAAECPRAVEDMEAAVYLFRGEVFRTSVEAHKKPKDVLAAKFDELLK